MSALMAENLRQEVLNDTGNSRFKAKVLDLISKLRLEASLLNPPKQPKIQVKEQHDVANQDADEAEKEPLGLDEHGFIKPCHDAEDIQKMLDAGILKKKVTKGAHRE